MTIRIPIFAVSTIAYCLFCNSMNAQWSANPNINNDICTATNVQGYPRIVSDGAGGAIIAWQDSRNGTSHIYAQRINAAGVWQWTDQGVAICTAAIGQLPPNIISDGAGGAIITWSDYRNSALDPGALDIYAQRINAAGAVQWTVNGVAICTAMGSQDTRATVSDDSGGAIITWTDTRNGPLDPSSNDIYAQRINAAGAVQWTTDGVAICTATGGQDYPTTMSDGTGGAIITWRDMRSGTDYDIYAQRINAAGTVQWTTDGVAISTATNYQLEPTIVSDGAGGAIITWYDYRNGSDADIYAQRINAAGAVQWTADGVGVCTATGNQDSPTAVSDSAGGAIITWMDDRNGPLDIFAQRINAAGALQWTADGVAISTAASNQDSHTVVSDGVGGAIITWEDYRSTTNYDIYAQRINATGAVQWTADGVAISTATGSQTIPAIVSDGAVGAIITWQDYRFGSGDIYASRVFSNGALPIQLASFTVVSERQDAELKWTTATEVNNYGFEIERRIVGVQQSAINWQTIAFVQGAGTSSSPRVYTYVDRGISVGHFAYRIKQIDKNGAFFYGATVDVEFGLAPKTLALGENYPNPFNPSTTIEFNVPQDGHAVLKIFDMLGRDVATLFEGEAKSGYYERIVFDASKLASGVYFSRLEFGGKQQLKKMVLMK